MLARLLSAMARHAMLLLPCALILGLAFQGLAAAMKPLITPFVVALLGIAMARTDLPVFRGVARRPWLPLAMVAVAMIGIPCATAPLLDMLPLSPGLKLALALMACLPPLTSMPAVAGFLGLDRARALFVTLAGTALMPLTVPPLALALLGLDIRIPFVDFMLRLASLVAAGLPLAVAIRSIVGEQRRQRAAPVIDGLAVLILLLFAIPIMDGVLGHIERTPWRTAGFVLSAFVATVLYMTVTMLAFWPAGRVLACTAAYAAGSRNNALLLAVLPATVDPDYFLFIAAVQFPIYLTPTLSRPVFRWLLRRQPPPS